MLRTSWVRAVSLLQTFPRTYGRGSEWLFTLVFFQSYPVLFLSSPVLFLPLPLLGLLHVLGLPALVRVLVLLLVHWSLDRPARVYVRGLPATFEHPAHDWFVVFSCHIY